MFETKYFSIDKLRKMYAEYWREAKKDPTAWKKLPEDNKFFDTSRIQLVGLDHPDYKYLKDREEKYFYLQCLLHGAAKRKPEKQPKKKPKKKRNGKLRRDKQDESQVFEDRLQDFLIKELRLLWGMYCFIDPKAVHERYAKPSYLIGPFKDYELKPSFTFPLFVNTKNIRNSTEFRKLPDEWLSFYLVFNAATRAEITFADDFVKFFGHQSWRRNEKLEQKDNFFYASSGEIDHTILQWLFCSLGSDVTLRSPFKIDLTKLSTDKTDIKKCLNFDNDGSVLNKFTSKGDLLLGRTSGGEALSLTINEWLQRFGLLDESMLPTERLMAAVEFAYFHLKFWQNPKVGFNTEPYFSRAREDNYYEDLVRSEEARLKKPIREFFKRCEKGLPVLKKSYNEIKDEIESVEILRKTLSDIVESYFKVLQACAAKSSFFEYARFNILSHFFQRNVLPLYNPLLKEQTCRGFVIFPIFSNPHESADNITDESSRVHPKNLGYFLGLIKDSEAKGRCYFNWRMHSYNSTESGTVNFFYEEYLFYLQNFVYNLGFNEVKQIYYKGIEEKHAKETRLQATHAAIADIINRNQAHHIGSHVSTRATLDKVLERLGKTPLDLCKEFEDSLYLSILDLLNRLNQYRDERSEYLTYLAQFSSPSSAYLFKDVLQPFMENTLLMDNIAANENINYLIDDEGKLSTNRLQMKVVLRHQGNTESLQAEYKKDSSVLYSTETLPYLRKKTSEGFEYDEVVLAPNKDIEVSLPGTLGKHALYSILENVIRNSAKHGSTKKHERLEIIIEISDLDNPDHITVDIRDNCSSVSDEMIDYLNQSIKTRILDRKDLGLIDMKVNACLLAGLELTDENCFDALAATKTAEGILSYRFHIARPKKAVFIGCCDQLGAREGYAYFASVDEFINAPISKSFKFGVVDKALLGNLKAKEKELLLSQLPARILDIKDIKDDLFKSNGSDFLTILYKHWNAHLSDSAEPNYQVHLTFRQPQEDRLTSSFLTAFRDSAILKIYSTNDLHERRAEKVVFAKDKQHIFFDRHGAIIEEGSNEFARSFVRDTEEGDKNHAWILIDKNNPDFDYISRYNLVNAEVLASELAEAGLLRILIIDERAAEQSSRVVESDTDLTKLRPHRFGFSKYDLSWQDGAFKNNKLTLFDSAWAANVFIATHLNKRPLKNNLTIKDGNKHLLEVNITNNEISYDVNFTSLYAKYNPKESEDDLASWTFTGDHPRSTSIDLRPHALVVHRTKLAELIKEFSPPNNTQVSFDPSRQKESPIIEMILREIPILIVTTGSGTTHGIDRIVKILPFSTLNDLVLGKRIQKLRLSKLLLELTKNRI